MVKPPTASRLFFAGCVALLLNSAYLVASPSASLWYYTNVIAHPLLGVAIALAAALRFARRERVAGGLAVAGVGAVLVGLVLGLVVFVVGATRQYEPILYAHIATSAMGAGLLIRCCVARHSVGRKLGMGRPRGSGGRRPGGGRGANGARRPRCPVAPGI